MPAPTGINLARVAREVDRQLRRAELRRWEAAVVAGLLGLAFTAAVFGLFISLAAG